MAGRVNAHGAGKQGTPVRFRDGPAAVTRRRGRLLQAIAGGAIGAFARRHAADEVWESEDLPGVMGSPDREGGMAGTAVRGRLCVRFVPTGS